MSFPNPQDVPQPQQEQAIPPSRHPIRIKDINGSKLCGPYSLFKELSPQRKVSACAFSLHHLAIGCENGSVLVYDLASWEVFKSYKRTKKVRVVRFSPCSRYLGIGSDDGTVILIDMDSSDDGKSDNNNAVNLIKRDSLIHALSFSPDGTELALGGFDGLVAIAKVTELGISVTRELSRLGVILSLDYSPCGKYFAIGASDMCVTVVEAESLNVVAEFKRLSSVQCVEWHPSGEWVAAGGRDGIVAVYDFTSKTLKEEIFPSSSKRVLCAGWNLDGSIMAIGGTDEFISIFETVGFETVQEIPRVGHVTCLAFHKQFFAVGEKGSKICIFRNPVLNSEYRRQKPDLDNRTLVKVHLGSSPLRNSETLGTSQCLSLNLVPRSWSRPELLKFLQISEDFLGKCTLEPSYTMTMISFLTAVRMLRYYLQRVRVLEDDRNEIALSLKDDLDFVTAFSRILHSSIEVMEVNISKEQVVFDAWWNMIRKFNIPVKDTKRIQVWNVKWRRARIVDPPFLDVDLLRSVDTPSSKEDAIDTNTLGDFSSTQSLSPSIDTVEESIIASQTTNANQMLDTITHSSAVDKSKASKYGSKPIKIITWVDVNEPPKFLQACKIFLAPFEIDSPSSHLRSFISAVLMLQCHVQWVNSSLSKEHETRLIQTPNALPTVCKVLKCFTTSMVKVSSNPPDTFSSLSSVLKLKLSSRDINSLHDWNSIFKCGDDDYLPLVDVSLMETILDDSSCEVAYSEYDFNNIDTNADSAMMMFLNKQLTNTNTDENYLLSSPATLAPSPLATSKMEEKYESSPEPSSIVRKISPEKSTEVHSCEFIKDLLWSTTTVEPYYKPEFMNVVHTSKKPMNSPPLTSNRRSSLPSVLPISGKYEQKVKKLISKNKPGIHESQQTNSPIKTVKRTTANRFESLSYVPRMFSHLKKNLATESKIPTTSDTNIPIKKINRRSSERTPRYSKPLTSSTYQTTSNETYVLPNNNRRSFLQNLNSRNRRSSWTPIPQSKLPDISSKRNSTTSPQELSSTQVSSSQQHTSSQVNSNNDKQKPKYVVSRVPNQALPVNYKK